MKHCSLWMQFAGTINARKDPELKTMNNMWVNNDEFVSQDFKIKPSLWVGSNIWVYSAEEAEASNEKSKLKNKSSFWVYSDDVKDDKLLGNEV